VPHTKQQHRTLPSAPSTGIKEAWTTGVVTKQNYTRSAAGAEAAQDHVFGAVYVYLDELGALHSRNLVFEGGRICDFDIEKTQLCMVLGDLHSEMKDPQAWTATVELVERLQPQAVAVHDILHFSTASHHNRNDGKHLYKTKDAQVIDDLRRVIDDLNELAALTPLVYVVESNHNSALDNWLHDIGYNPKRDPRQAKLYYLLNYLVTEAMDEGQDVTALQVAFENLAKFKEFPQLAENVVFGDMDKAEIWYGSDVSVHGHRGQNGSAGSTALFSRWCLPMVTGHTHSPAIIGKVLTVGVTASLKQGYNRGGASSWRQSHGIIYPNGTRQLVPVFGLV
jgi:hypothetical protein